MKRHIFLLAIVCVLGLISCDEEIKNVSVSSISLNETVFNLNVGETANLVATVKPDNANEKLVIWSSDNEGVATVDDNGVVTAKGKGVANIKATSKNNSSITAICVINVSKVLTSLNIIKNLSLLINGTITINTNVSPKDANDTTVTWTSSNETLATVSSKGLITAKNIQGTVNITATSKSNSKLSETCVLKISKPLTAIGLISNITIEELQTYQLGTNVSPKDASDTSVIWNSLSTDIATVNALTGEVTAKTGGTAIITATSKISSAVMESCTVKVTKILVSLNILRNLTLPLNGTYTLITNVFPKDVLDTTVTWSSSDVALATVTSNGEISAKNTQGTVNIIATSKRNPNLSETCTLKISKPLTSIGLISSLTLKERQTYQLGTNVAPKDVLDTTVTWTSSSNAIATVSSTGEITAISKGNVNIIATSKSNTNLSAICVLQVKRSLKTLGIVSSITLDKLQTSQLGTNVTPKDVEDTTVFWTSSDPAIATVDRTSGLVTAVSSGTVNITATSNYNSDITQVLVVNVRGFIINNRKIQVFPKETGTLTTTFIPSDFADKSLTWTSRDNSIATVENGVVTGVSAGITFILAVSSVDNTLIDSSEVTVKGIRFNNKKITLNGIYVYGIIDYTITYTKYPSNLDIGTLTWKSNNTERVKVNSNGFVEKIIDGAFAKISAVSSIDNRITDTADVQVIGITFDKTSVYLLKNNTANIKVSYYNLDGSIDEKKTSVAYVSDNPAIASVNSDGLVTANDYGSTNIKYNDIIVSFITSTGSKSGSYVDAISRIYVPKIEIVNNLTIFSNRGNKLTVNLIPSDIPDKTIIYESSNPNIATINADGTINKFGLGTTNITAKYRFNTSDEVSTTSVLNVYNFYLNKNELFLVKNNSENLVANVDLLGSISNAYTWSSSDNAIATVSSSGEVRAVNSGQATIYITSDINTIYKDSCIVKITRNAYISEFKFEKVKNPGMQNDLRLTNYNINQYGGDFKYIANNKLIPTFSVSPGATVKVNNMVQTSGVSEVDFTSAVNYVVTSSSGLESETYRIALNFINDTINVDNSGELLLDLKYINNVSTAILADSMNGFIVTSIGKYAFYDGSISSKVQTLSINNKITEIKPLAFYYNSYLKGDLYFPPNVNKIGQLAFGECSGINSIRYKAEISVASNAFLNIDAAKISTYTWP